MMNLETLKSIAWELNNCIKGGFINKIHQPLPRDICLKIRVRGRGERKLIMSADPQFGRLHLTDLRIPNPRTPPRFCQFLRAHLQGSIVQEVTVAHDDRLVTLKCSKTAGGDVVARHLILELLGRDSNILLVDGFSHLLMDCLHQIPATERATRAVMPGMEYVPPPRRPLSPQGTKVDPSAFPTAQSKQDSSAEAGVGLSRISYEAGEEPLLANSEAEAEYAPRIEKLITDSFRRIHTVPLRKRLASLARRMEKIQKDRARLETYMANQEKGELLKANLHKLKKGMKRIELSDWTGEGKVTIDLDPVLDGIRNMQRIFAKAAKGKRGMVMVYRRMEDSLAEKMALEDLLFLLQDAKNSADIESIVEGMGPDSGRPNKSRKEREQPPERAWAKWYRIFTSPSGFQIFVGKTALGNDFLLRHRADSLDLWFHAKDVPGAHVIMRIPQGKVHTEDDAEKAAALAGYFSQARSAGRTEIIMTQAKNVGRIKGKLPGCVNISSYKTLFVTWEDLNISP
jgi:predicted ribosome quality control (RQC) complex YloA/Tae2 family protein